MSGGPSSFPQHSAGRNIWVVTAVYLRSEPLQGPPSLRAPHKVLQIPEAIG